MKYNSFKQLSHLFYKLKQNLTQDFGEAEDDDLYDGRDDDDDVTFQVDIGKYK